MLEYWQRIVVMIKDKYNPDIAVHPGEYLAEEISARTMTQKEISSIITRYFPD